MDAASVNAVWATIQAHLENEMRRVHDEIRSYPAPIPACDAQFNHLLEERDALSSELTRAREFMNKKAESDDAKNFIDAFLNDSICLGDAGKNEIRALIENDNPRREGEQ